MPNNSVFDFYKVAESMLFKMSDDTLNTFVEAFKNPELLQEFKTMLKEEWNYRNQEH